MSRRTDRPHALHAGASPFAQAWVRGLAAISPGRGACLRVDRLPAGSYTMLCFAALKCSVAPWRSKQRPSKSVRLRARAEPVQCP
jgi:hypothetical protein